MQDGKPFKSLRALVIGLCGVVCATVFGAVLEPVVEPLVKPYVEPMLRKVSELRPPWSEPEAEETERSRRTEPARDVGREPAAETGRVPTPDDLFRADRSRSRGTEEDPAQERRRVGLDEFFADDPPRPRAFADDFRTGETEGARARIGFGKPLAPEEWE